jgi:hypothetical protein
MHTFDKLRTAAFKAILLKSFKVMPRRLDEIFAAAGWSTFTDFMADVNLFGMELRSGTKTLDQANTKGMIELLGELFRVSEPEATRNLQDLDIASWRGMTMATTELAVEIYATDHGGRTPLDDAKETTRKFLTMDLKNPGQVREVVEAFGFPSPTHFEAVLHAVFSAEMTPEDLDQALEHPEILEELVNRSPSNPHKSLKFTGAKGTP